LARTLPLARWVPEETRVDLTVSSGIVREGRTRAR
jgi:hypothetical protein